MMELKVKFFRAHDSSHQNMLKNLEKNLESWQLETLGVRVQRTYLTVIPENERIYSSLIFTVEYIEISKRNIIVETNG